MKWTPKSTKNFLDYFYKKYQEWAIRPENTQRYVKKLESLCTKEYFFYSKFPELFEKSKKECKIGNEFSPYYERVEYLIQQYHPDIEQRYLNCSTKYKSDIKSAIRSFTKFIWTFFDGSCFADEYMNQMNITTTSPKELIAQIVAGTSIMLPPKFIENIKQNDNSFANASGELKYYRNNKIKKGSKKNPVSNVIVGGFTYSSLIPDDNTHANTSLKQNILKCVGLPVSLYTLFINYTVCHIWAHPEDPRYYDNLQNLALVPSFLAGLTDHNKDIKDILRQRAFNQYGFCEYYDSIKGANTPNSKCDERKLNNKIQGFPTDWRSFE